MSGADRDGRGMDYLRPFLPGLESVLEDEDVSEIMINGPGNVWVERRGEIRQHPAPGLDGAALDRAAIQIARPLGLDPASSPILDARLDDGSRVAICVPPAAPHVAITIRRFGKRSYSPEDLVRFGSLPQEVLDAARAALLGRRNILVSGGTGSGKTTLLNALVELLPADDRIVSIEDTLELRIERKNCVRFEARGIDGESVTIRDLVRHALRHRPDHIVVGEVRGGEAADLLQALNTGHGGSLTTIHANNAESALSRLATCAMQGETDLPWEVTCRGVVDGISMVIHMTRREGRRFVEEALFVRSYDAGKNSWQTDPVWPVKHDKDMEACQDMNDKSKPALSPVSPQARHRHTRFDQVNQLVGASEADPDLGFMGRVLALCSLPRTNPGTRDRYVRKNGPFTLIMIAGEEIPELPYGTLPRLLMAWVSTEAVRTQSRELVLGDSLSDFMRTLGIYNSGGHPQTRLKNQMRRLFSASIRLIHKHEHGERFIASQIADRGEFWWNPKRPEDRTLWQSKIELGEKFFQETVRNPVPLDMNTLKALRRSPLGLDLYMWLTYRTFSLDGPLRLSWPMLYRQFGADPSRGSDKFAVRNFRTDCLRELKKIKMAWPGLEYRIERGRRHEKSGALVLLPSAPQIPPLKLVQ